MFHNMIIRSKDDKKKFLYDRLIKIVLHNIIDQLRNECGQKDELKELKNLDAGKKQVAANAHSRIQDGVILIVNK